MPQRSSSVIWHQVQLFDSTAYEQTLTLQTCSYIHILNMENLDSLNIAKNDARNHYEYL